MPKYLIEGELGIPHDELENAIKILEEADFCRFYDDEYVFVYKMARYQIADALSPDDNRWKSLMRDIEEMPDNIRREFIIRYNDDFNLGYRIIRKAAEPTAPELSAPQVENNQGKDKPLATCQSAETKPLEAASESENKPLNSQTQPELEPLVLESEAPCKPLISPFQAPCKPVTVTETVSVAVTEEEVPVGKRRPATSRPRKATHRFDLKELPEEWRKHCEKIRPDLDPYKVFAEFSYYWQSKNTAKALRSDDGWNRTWNLHIQDLRPNRSNIKNGPINAPNAGSPTPPSGLSEAAMAEMQKMRF